MKLILIATVIALLAGPAAAQQERQKHWICKAEDGTEKRVAEKDMTGYCERDSSEPAEGTWQAPVVLVCSAPNGKQSVAKADLPDQACKNMTLSEIRTGIPALGPAAEAFLKQKNLQLFCASQPGASCAEPESGRDEGTIFGARFVIHPDSAKVEAIPGADLLHANENTWELACLRDKMSNAASCHARKGELSLNFPRGHRAYVQVGNGQFPGSQTSIRIGARRFDTTNRDGIFAQANIVPLLKDGTSVVTRFMKWPQRNWVDDEFKLHGAQAAATIAKWMSKHMEPASGQR